VNRATNYTHEFVEFVPENLADGVVYVSIEYATASHNCMCGCGSKIITPLAPNRWSITFDGETVSLKPSIGNWSFPCQSHYWLRRGRVDWARKWTRHEIEVGRAFDAIDQAPWNPDLAPGAGARRGSDGGRAGTPAAVLRAPIVPESPRASLVNRRDCRPVIR
jgi:Family of unknown function (DUF6527)